MSIKLNSGFKKVPVIYYKPVGITACYIPVGIFLLYILLFIHRYIYIPNKISELLTCMTFIYNHLDSLIKIDIRSR